MLCNLPLLGGECLGVVHFFYLRPILALGSLSIIFHPCQKSKTEKRGSGELVYLFKTKWDEVPEVPGHKNHPGVK